MSPVNRDCSGIKLQGHLQQGQESTIQSLHVAVVEYGERSIYHFRPPLTQPRKKRVHLRKSDRVSPVHPLLPLVFLRRHQPPQAPHAHDSTEINKHSIKPQCTNVA